MHAPPIETGAPPPRPAAQVAHAYMHQGVHSHDAVPEDIPRNRNAMREEVLGANAQAIVNARKNRFERLRTQARP